MNKLTRIEELARKLNQEILALEVVQEYQNHPLVVNYLYLQNEVNEILQTINQQMNNALK